MHEWRTVARLAVLAALAALAGCVDLGDPVPDAAPEPDTGLEDLDGGPVVHVDISGMAFRPTSVDIARGTTVIWKNWDAVAHTATQGKPNDSGTPLFDSPLLDAGGTFEFRFDSAGSWLYYCRTHPAFMKDCVVNVR